MNEKAIKRMRIKIIKIAMLSLFLVMLFIGFTINLVSIISSHRVVSDVLDRIIENDGEMIFTERRVEYGSDGFLTITDVFSPQYKHYSRYFVATYVDGEVFDIDTAFDSNIDTDEATYYADRVKNRHKKFGRVGMYYYKFATLSDGRNVGVFLDCTSEIVQLGRLIYFSTVICVLGLMLTYVLASYFSRHLVKQEIENTGRQREFITNASHELKTPLAVIRANTELLEMTEGENEWTKSTLKQVDHMDGLIKNLVMIAKAEEKADRSGLVDVNVSQAVEEAVSNFDAMAKTDGITLVRAIEPDVHMLIEEGRMRQLAGLLMDNAMKYCDEHGTVTASLVSLRKGKQVRLEVSNHYAEGSCVDCNKFFDRFYRADESHEQKIKKEGYGIGLSMAESICKQYGGGIRAFWKDGVITFSCTLSSGL